MRVLAALKVREQRTQNESAADGKNKSDIHCPHAGKGSVPGPGPPPRSRTVVENRTPGKRCSKMERSILDNFTRPPTQMNCVFPGFNLRRFKDNQAPITSETRSIFSTREIASEAALWTYA